MKRGKKDSVEELLQTLLIVELGLAGVPQPDIRKIVGVDMHRVNGIVRHLKNARKRYAG